MATFTGNASSETFGGTTDNDNAFGGAGDDVLYGAEGADTLNGGPGADRLDGGDGGDFLGTGGGASPNPVNPYPGVDTLLGGLGDDTLVASSTILNIGGVDYPTAFGTLYLPGDVFDGGAGADYLRITGHVDLSAASISNIEGVYFTEAGHSLQPNGVDVKFGPAILDLTGASAFALPANADFGGVGTLVVELNSASTYDASQFTFQAGSNVAIQIIGSDANDSIVGSSRGDTIGGEDGNDTLTGGAGADVFVIDGTGQKILTDFTVGVDKLDVSDAGFASFQALQPYMSQVGADVVFGITYGGAFHTYTLKNVSLASLNASSFLFDTDTASSSDSGTELADVMVGGLGADTLAGLGGNDTLTGDAGNDSLSGGDGDDNIGGGLHADTLSGGAGNDTVIGSGPDLVDGGSGRDTIVMVGAGGGGATLNGGADDDTFVALNLIGLPAGTFAGTSFNGGAGHDTLVIGGPVNFQGALASIEGLHLMAADPAANRGAAVLDIGSNFELNPDYEGGPATLQVSGSGLIRYTATQVGDNIDASDVSFYEGSSVTFEIHGSSGADSITGSSNGDSLVGEAGADLVVGGGGNDTLAGLAGADSLEGGEGSDNLAGGNDADTLAGGAGADTLDGGFGVDLLLGGDGVDNLNAIAGQGGDTLDGGAGDDVLSVLSFSVLAPGNPTPLVTFAGDFAGSRYVGGAGYDTLVVAGGTTFRGSIDGIEEVFLRPAVDIASGPNTLHFAPTILNIGSGFEAVSGGAANVTVSGAGQIVYTIDDGDNALNLSQVQFRAGSNVTFEARGSAGADTIFGSSAADLIYGNDGSDRIVAGAGDIVRLGDGAYGDTFVIDTSMTVGARSITVMDFQAGAGGDALAISDFLTARTNWVAGTNPFASGHLRLVQAGADSLLQVDANGGGDQFAVVAELRGVNSIALVPANLGGWAPSVQGGTTNDTVAFAPQAPVQAGDAPPALDGGAGVDTLKLDTASLNPATVVGPASIKPSADGASLLFDLNGDGVTDLVVTNVEDVFFNGRQVVISGDLAGTGLAPNTIHYGGTDQNDLFDAGGLTSLQSVRASGGGGDDKITGANDDDTLEGGDGADSLTGRGGPDSLNGGAGADDLRGGDDADTLDGGADGDKLFGDSGDDLLFGGLGADSLDGGNGKDSLSGGDGADVLFGGNGQDTLRGGDGADTFRIENGAADRILDFNHGQGDVLVFVGGKGSVSWKFVDADGDAHKDDLLVSAGGGFSVELIDFQGSALDPKDWIFS